MRSSAISVVCCFLLLLAACGDDPAPPKDHNSNETDFGFDIGEQTDMDGATGGGEDMAPDAGPLCGNQIVDPLETCDGDCREDCDDQDVCTTDTLQGAGATCDSVCMNEPITSCADADGCCPAGCDNADDSDCAAVCENGVVETGETCDQNCPTACDDSDSCTTNALSGTAASCDVVCTYPAITTCVDDDGCCAPGCDANTDSDCAPDCGNTVVEPPETCDGNCRADCNDTNACTTDVMLGTAAACSVVCTNAPITMCINGDGCCAPGCTPFDDDDCSGTCGNNTIEPNETCDPISDCPTTCADTDVCTTDMLTGSAANCDALCVFSPIVACTNDDGCCAPGCNGANDNDCMSVCGNSIPEPGEECDDGNVDPTDACDMCVSNSPPTVFRMSDLDLVDPHVFGFLFNTFCADMTNTVFGQDGVNPQVQTSLTTDGDNDGLLDLSVLTVFRPLDQAAVGGSVDVVEGDCTAPATSASCQPTLAAAVVNYTYTNQTAGTCLSTLPGTTSGYTPGVASPTGPCFATNSQTFTLDLAGIIISLNDTQIGATYVGNPAASMSTGLVRGFLTEAAAELIILPMTIPLVGGASLASLLPGYATNCHTGDDMDTHPTLGDGWWMYLNFPANQVAYTGP